MDRKWNIYEFFSNHKEYIEFYFSPHDLYIASIGHKYIILSGSCITTGYSTMIMGSTDYTYPFFTLKFEGTNNEGVILKPQNTSDSPSMTSLSESSKAKYKQAAQNALTNSIRPP